MSNRLPVATWYWCGVHKVSPGECCLYFCFLATSQNYWVQIRMMYWQTGGKNNNASCPLGVSTAHFGLHVWSLSEFKSRSIQEVSSKVFYSVHQCHICIVVQSLFAVIFSHVSSVAVQRLWSQLKHLNSYSMDFHEIWFRHSQSHENESWWHSIWSTDFSCCATS